MSSRPTIVVDVDGTLCHTIDPVGYTDCTPRSEMIRIVNKLYDKGARIIIFTARGMGRNNGNVNACYEQFYDITEKWLNDNGVKYHELRMGKPAGDYYVDDKGLNIDELLKIDIDELLLG